jgi:hypothetical protein
MKYAMNEVKLDMANYRHYWRGQPKVGKSTLFRDLIIHAYGDAKYGLLLSMGQELGFKSLTNLFAHSCPEWADFVDTVDDLVENKSENEFKILGLDTVDELVEMSEREVMRLHRVSKNESASSINASHGGYGAGKRMARTLIEKQIARLERAGYGMIYISHTKVKDINEKATDQAYQQLTGALEFAYDAIFSDRADVMAMMVTESSVKDERLKESSRYIYLRATNFIDAGSRLPNLPEKIELSAKAYLDAINSALEKTSGKSGKEAEKARKQEEKVRVEEATKFSEEQKNEHYGEEEVSVEAYKEKMLEVAKGLSTEGKKLKKAELKRLGLPEGFTDIEDMETLKKIYGVLSRD